MSWRLYRRKDFNFWTPLYSLRPVLICRKNNAKKKECSDCTYYAQRARNAACRECVNLSQFKKRRGDDGFALDIESKELLELNREDDVLESECYPISKDELTVEELLTASAAFLQHLSEVEP